MRKYIYSTCGQPQVFKFYEQLPKDSTVTVSRERKDKDGKPLEIRLEGNAYVLLYNQGVARKVAVTEVTEEQLELLHTNDSYMRMKARGFFTEHDAARPEYDRQSGNVMDMEKKDNTSQISDHDHAKGLDERLNHAGTRATSGLGNTNGGEQPLAAEDGNYGQIFL